MASRIIHSAIISEILKRAEISSPERLKLGAVLPDAGTGGNDHFRKKKDGTQKTFYDLSEFRRRFGDKLITDDLYLGYYLHLFQDALFRHLIFEEHDAYTATPENIAKLHNDYSLLNAHVIGKYGLKHDIIIPDDLETEEISKLFPFEPRAFLEKMKRDHEPFAEGETVFLTEEMTDGFIGRAVKICLMEIEAVRCGETMISDEPEFSFII